MEHTKTPWKRDKAHLYAAYKGAPVVVATFHSEQDAALAMLAANTHDALVAAAITMREQFYRHTCKHRGAGMGMICDKCEALDALEAAIKLAK